MRRTYRSKKDTADALDRRDVLLSIDDKSSAFDAFYIQNIKQTKRELSCIGSTNQYGVVSSKVSKRKYVKRIVREATPPPRESLSDSVFLTPDKSIHVKRVPDLFDLLLQSSPACNVDIKQVKTDDSFKLLQKPSKTYTKKKEHKYTRKKKDSYESDKENSKTNKETIQNVTDIREHELIIEKEHTPCRKWDRSIDKIVNNISLLNKIQRKTLGTPNKTYRSARNRLTNSESQKSPLSSTPFMNKTRSKSIYKFSPIRMGDFEESQNYVTVMEDNEPNKSIILAPKSVPKLMTNVNSPMTHLPLDSSQSRRFSKPLFSSEDASSKSSVEKSSKEIASNQDIEKNTFGEIQTSLISPFLGFSEETVAKSNADIEANEMNNSLILPTRTLSKSKHKSKDNSSAENCGETNSKERIHHALKDASYFSSIEYSTTVQPFHGFSKINENNLSSISGHHEMINECNNVTNNAESQNNGADISSNDESNHYEGNHISTSNNISTNNNTQNSTDEEDHTSHSVEEEISQMTNKDTFSDESISEAESLQENKSCHTSSDSQSIEINSLYDSCNSEHGYVEDNVGVVKGPIETTERLHDSLFNKYFDEMPEFRKSSSVHDECDSISDEANNFENSGEVSKEYDSVTEERDVSENEDNVDQTLNKPNESAQSDQEANASITENDGDETVYRLNQSSQSVDKSYISQTENSQTDYSVSQMENDETVYRLNQSTPSDDDENVALEIQKSNDDCNDVSQIEKSDSDVSDPNQTENSDRDISHIEIDGNDTINRLNETTLHSEDECPKGEEKCISFVTTRRRNEVTNNSTIYVFNDSFDTSSSTENDKTVLSNNVNLRSSTDKTDCIEVNSTLTNTTLNQIPKKTKNTEENIETEREVSTSYDLGESLDNANISDVAEIRPCIVLEPGKKWERSLSIYRRMTMANDCVNHSILDEEDLQTKGRKYRQSVIHTMEMQDKGTLHNESIQSRRSTFVCKPSRSTIRIVKESNNSRISLSSTAVIDDLNGFLEDCDDTIVELSKLSLTDGQVSVLEKFHEPTRIATPRDFVLRRCNQTEVLLFDECYPDPVLKNCRKIGEGVYGEVFLWRATDGRARVMKIVPVAGTTRVNGEHQKDFHEIISEIVIAMELSALRAPIPEIESHFDEDKEIDALDLHSVENATDIFNEVLAVRCVYGNYPSRLLDLWELYDETKGSENDNPAILPSDQQYIVLELANAGQDLESYQFNSAEQAHALFLQIAFGLAVGEEAFQFEHRDLHWGNVLIQPTDQKFATFVLRGRLHRVPRRGVAATIIDYSLSRLSLPLALDKAALYNDLSTDDSLFGAVGDYQFAVYRLMRDKLGNDWKNFEPYTNILWLHYTLDKMITALRYKRTNTKTHKQYIAKLKDLKERILSYGSAVQFVLTDNEY